LQLIGGIFARCIFPARLGFLGGATPEMVSQFSLSIVSLAKMEQPFERHLLGNTGGDI
jgi:hypothetical protein